MSWGILRLAVTFDLVVVCTRRYLEDCVSDSPKAHTLVNRFLRKVQTDSGSVIVQLAIRSVVNIHNEVGVCRNLPCGTRLKGLWCAAGRPEIEDNV